MSDLVHYPSSDLVVPTNNNSLGADLNVPASDLITIDREKLNDLIRNSVKAAVDEALSVYESEMFKNLQTAKNNYIETLSDDTPSHSTELELLDGFIKYLFIDADVVNNTN